MNEYMSRRRRRDRYRGIRVNGRKKRKGDSVTEGVEEDEDEVESPSWSFVSSSSFCPVSSGTVASSPKRWKSAERKRWEEASETAVVRSEDALRIAEQRERHCVDVHDWRNASSPSSSRENTNDPSSFSRTMCLKDILIFWSLSSQNSRKGKLLASSAESKNR